MDSQTTTFIVGVATTPELLRPLSHCFAPSLSCFMRNARVARRWVEAGLVGCVGADGFKEGVVDFEDRAFGGELARLAWLNLPAFGLVDLISLSSSAGFGPGRHQLGSGLSRAGSAVLCRRASSSFLYRRGCASRA